MDNDQLSQSDPPTVEDLSSFRNGHDERDTDVFIAVMGVTGAGKSSLISKLTTGEVTPKIGHDLRSCTQEVDVFQFVYSPTVNVYLIDTPGFDDTDISDSDILKTLAARLTGMYSRKIPLHGILYLHRISDVRLAGSGMKNLRVFRKLCGPDALKKVILVTTLWDQVSESVGAAREEELRATEDFWGSMIKKGSRIERYSNSKESAVKLVGLLIQASQSADVVQTPLQIQNEMVNGATELNGTEAAREIMEPLKKRTKKRTRELEEVRQEAEEDPGDEDEQHQQQKTIEDLETRIRQDRHLRRCMDSAFATTFDKLLQDKDWGAVQKLYPELFEFLSKNRNTACPTSISLGPAGSYFINVDGRTSFKCHPETPIDIEASYSSRLWWGANGSYVLEFSDKRKTLRWDLKGQYGSLDEILQEMGTGKMKELALNIEDGSSFALILTDGSAYHEGLDDIRDILGK
ncbi:hypothetical protein LQW54_004308 [Pestalotiopsis sp. IQ-011]